MNSPNPRYLRRVIEQALRPARHESSGFGSAVRRLAVEIQRQTAGSLCRRELVDQIVSWIAEGRSAQGAAGGQWPTAVLQETRCELAPGFGV